MFDYIKKNLDDLFSGLDLKKMEKSELETRKFIFRSMMDVFNGWKPEKRGKEIFMRKMTEEEVKELDDFVESFFKDNNNG